MSEQTPAFEILGHLDDVVLENGKNNDDGWGTCPNPDDEKVPPEILTKGILFFLRERFLSKQAK